MSSKKQHIKKPGPSVSEEKNEAFLDHTTGKFFRKVDCFAFWAAFFIIFIVYTYSLAPTVTLEDSGELAVASDYLGVPHPPGYPIWTLVTWFFQWIFHWVKYFGQPDNSFVLIGKSFLALLGVDAYQGGHPNPAWSVGLMSAFFGALTCAILALIVSRSGADILRSMTRVTEVLGYKSERMICWVAGVAGGLMLAFSEGLWSQSVIVEVYSFNTFFMMIVLLMAYRWMSRPKKAVYLIAMAFLFGLGLTNHQTLMFLGAALAITVLLKDAELFRDFLTAGIPLAGVIGFNVIAAKMGWKDLLWSRGPDTAAFWVHTSLAFAIPMAAYFFLPNGKVVGATFLMAELGVCFYLYLPFASEGNPPMNWAYPRTWDGFLHSITRGQYEKVTLSDVFGNPQKFLAQLGTYFSGLRAQFTIPIVLLGVLPFSAWSLKCGAKRLSFFYIAFTFAGLSTLFGLLPKITGVDPDDSAFTAFYKLFAVLLLFILAIGMTVMVIHYVLIELKKGGLASGLIIFVLAVAAIGLVYFDVQILKLLFGSEGTGSDRTIYAIVIFGPLLFLGLVYWFVAGPLKMRMDIDEHSIKWLLVTIIAFVTLSVILLVFLNPKLDIQTLFIQRVQHIQSHAVFAIWIGYGFLFLLARVETTLGGMGIVKVLGIGVVALAAFIPIWENLHNERRIEIYGGSEQTGHDFGWQFGHWQLRGANAIIPELGPDEKLPNPEYPPEIGPDAIFFGGTDPGRFVPTYMIYSAKVRPDVYLITQNALADNTYMNVMRDLMGDDIWIPGQQDSNMAFQKYVQDVQAGKIPAGAAVNVKDGRVSVQGVQGVMMINGILAKMIFDHNKHKHPFYLEESYVINWMYPYLEPHGLIMKINKERIEITADSEVVKNDREFWDWYCNRLLGNEKFIRDVVARKTFSKLRSAIAGIYAWRRIYPEAEYAFKQAIDLYPLSPEANFRLADIYMQQRQYSKGREVIEALLAGDPENDKVEQFLKQIKGFETADKQRKELEAICGSGSCDINTALQLAQAYLRLGMNGQFQQLTMKIIEDPKIPLQYYLQIGQLFAGAKRYDLLEKALTKYLERDPANVQIWIDLAAVHISRKNNTESLKALKKAVDLAGEGARNIIRNDKRFDSLRNNNAYKKLMPRAARPAQIPLNIPGL